jgi:heme/copper-type cytochrome/quinol oxidase subunit 2
MLGFGLLFLAIVWLPLPAGSSQPVERHIQVRASSFEYDPGTIRVNRGDHVTLELVSTDVVHGIYIDGYNLAVSADPGQTARLSFVADRAGSFRMRCSVTCGPLHPFMIGKLKVGSNPLLYRGAGLAVAAILAGLAFARKA